MSHRSQNSHRHTVPNASYSSFPCYQEEVKLKTNVRQYDPEDNAPITEHDKFQLNVSMHDKLKMCFAEMETMKDQFSSSRRRKLPAKRKSQNESTLITKNIPAPSSVAEDELAQIVDSKQLSEKANKKEISTGQCPIRLTNIY